MFDQLLKELDFGKNKFTELPQVGEFVRMIKFSVSMGHACDQLSLVDDADKFLPNLTVATYALVGSTFGHLLTKAEMNNLMQIMVTVTKNSSRQLVQTRDSHLAKGEDFERETKVTLISALLLTTMAAWKNWKEFEAKEMAKEVKP